MYRLVICLLFSYAVFAEEAITTAGGYTIETSALSYLTEDESAPAVYYISDISPEGLMAAYAALGVELPGKIGVKMSTGESTRSNYLRPALIGQMIQSLNGTIVEYNTAYGGSRSSTAMHRQQAKDNGLLDVAELDILDEEGSMELPVENGARLNVDYVGSHFAGYDSFLVLTHFKGHAMAGMGGAMKNISIGIGSSNGKANIHTAGKTKKTQGMWGSMASQDAFLESMADACKAVIGYVGAENMLYINVANRLSVDCDCDGNPHEPEMADLGIFASTDPVALDQACYDAVVNADDPGKKALIKRMEEKHAIHIVEAAAELGLGKREYKIVEI